MERKLTDPLSADVAQASVLVLWNKSSALINKTNYQEAEIWLNICNHGIFNQLDESNQGKIQRKLLGCCEELNKWNEIWTVYKSKMTNQQQRHPLSLSFLFKYHSNCRETDKARQVLNEIVRVIDKSSDSLKILSLCVHKARDDQNNELTLQGMKIILQFISEVDSDNNSDNIVDIPALIRAIGQVYFKAFKTREYTQRQEICTVLEQGNAIYLKKHNIKFDLGDLTWLASKCYQVSKDIVNIRDDDDLGFRLTRCGLSYLKSVPQGIEKSRYEYLMTLNVYFLYKKQSNFQVGDSHAILCKEMQRISRMARELIESLEKNEALDDMISRLILYDLVGTIQMEEYESVESLVKELLKTDKNGGIETAVSAILSCAHNNNHHHHQLISSFKLIVKDKLSQLSSTVDTDTIIMLSRWIRLLVDLTITTDQTTCEGILPQLHDWMRLARLSI